MKSRVKGDFHARFRENAMVKVHGVTQLCPILKKGIRTFTQSEIHYKIYNYEQTYT
jgi:hypothetical protein